MKVYISVDMEGATGICSPTQTSKQGQFFNQGRQLLLSDVNAAVEGALAGGATEVIVVDLHNGSFNIPHEGIHPEAKVIYGVPHLGPRFPLLDSSIDVMFLLGYHAKAGTHWGTLEHTMSSKAWHRLIVNGHEIGEVGVDAAIAGALNVPVVLVSGDDKVTTEARSLLGPIETAETKKGLGRERALCLSLEKTKEIIYNAAKNSLKLKNKIKPFSFESPAEIEITYKNTSNADGVALNNPNIIRKDGYTVIYKYEKFTDWLGGTWKEGEK